MRPSFLLHSHQDVIVGFGASEPDTVVDCIEARATELTDVRLHQGFPCGKRAYIEGEFEGHLRHVSWFLSPFNKDAFQRGACDLAPNNFSSLPSLMRAAARDPLIVASVSPPDERGFFSLGVCADYSAAMIGELPFFLEANRQMPFTVGQNQIHISQVVGWCESDLPLWELPAPQPTDVDRAIAEHVVDRIPDGATIEVGYGDTPGAVIGLLANHRELGVHTELIRPLAISSG